jgi:hypothetical protein
MTTGYDMKRCAVIGKPETPGGAKLRPKVNAALRMDGPDNLAKQRPAPVVCTRHYMNLRCLLAKVIADLSRSIGYHPIGYHP